MRIFRSPWGQIELTEERKKHILLFHPEVGACLRFFGSTVSNPQEVSTSVNDKSVVICYSFLTSRKKYLAVVIKLKPQSNFINTNQSIIRIYKYLRMGTPSTFDSKRIKSAGLFGAARRVKRPAVPLLIFTLTAYLTKKIKRT